MGRSPYGDAALAIGLSDWSLGALPSAHVGVRLHVAVLACLDRSGRPFSRIRSSRSMGRGLRPCYEQRLVWSFLQSAMGSPHVLVATAMSLCELNWHATICRPRPGFEPGLERICNPPRDHSATRPLPEASSPSCVFFPRRGRRPRSRPVADHGALALTPSNPALLRRETALSVASRVVASFEASFSL